MLEELYWVHYTLITVLENLPGMYGLFLIEYNTNIRPLQT
ncbi:protein of unknown function [Bartonella clarridgeiae 73]|uniref:Uncharacterized protein n=1 Tax=Bartonella clarridgeiae (strain CCUG 45776 / CIP 104772 / 73) TaxID=696125 RepID=E6YHC6_BARC7|nr:protein of unknown function [Bartonella clarridgeiae 73]